MRVARALRGLQETRVATREESGVLGFPSRRGLTPWESLECNPEIPAFPGEENYLQPLSGRSIYQPDTHQGGSVCSLPHLQWASVKLEPTSQLGGRLCIPPTLSMMRKPGPAPVL